MNDFSDRNDGNIGVTVIFMAIMFYSRLASFLGASIQIVDQAALQYSHIPTDMLVGSS